MIEARPTPDFATYPWVPISIVDGVLPNVHVAWADGPDLDCYSLWLFENSRAIDPVTRECVCVCVCVCVCAYTVDGIN